MLAREMPYANSMRAAARPAEDMIPVPVVRCLTAATRRDIATPVFTSH